MFKYHTSIRMVKDIEKSAIPMRYAENIETLILSLYYFKDIILISSFSILFIINSKKLNGSSIWITKVLFVPKLTAYFFLEYRNAKASIEKNICGRFFNTILEMLQK